MIPLLKHFRFRHLQHPPAKDLAARFAAFAQELSDVLPHDNAETTTAIRKLLESKDCAVRAMLPPPESVDIAAELAAHRTERWSAGEIEKLDVDTQEKR